MCAPSAVTLCFACQAARAAGRNPYPHKFHTTMLLPAYVAAYSALQAGEQRADETVAIAGERISHSTHATRGSNASYLHGNLFAAVGHGKYREG